MELKGRLKLIADKVPVCDTVCDIGTDHGYIPIYLVINQICKRAIASDLKRGPIESAKENIDEYNLADNIEARLGHGLIPIKQGEADAIVIAGMGGVLIREILKVGLQKAKEARALILQPMSGIENLREWLYGNGFYIYDEEMVIEGEKLYDVISARWTGCVRDVDEIYYYIGEKLIQKRDPLLRRYINKKLKQVGKVIADMENVDSESKVKEKYINVRDKLAEILSNLS